MIKTNMPPFYICRTLLGFGAGEPDLNRVFLQMPTGRAFVLCEMNEPRTELQTQRWHDLAKKLSEEWNNGRG
jgi:hypothetical protein